MPKMNPIIAKQALAAQRQGESLTEFFRAKGVPLRNGLNYLSKYRRKIACKSSDTMA